MKSGIAIFDLDGTLTTTTEVDSSCFVAAIESVFAFTPDSDWGSYEHCTDEGIATEALSRHFGRPPRRSEVDRLKTRFFKLLSHAASTRPEAFTAMPGGVTLLRHLVDAGWLVCVATGAWRGSAELKIWASGLPTSIPLFTSDGHSSRAAIVAAAISHAKAEAPANVHRIVSVGDSVWDVQTALQLRLPFLGVGSGQRAATLSSAGAVAIVPDFTDLELAVHQLELAPIPTATPYGVD
jgi:phosphoglycolate phosphatase-like HAD superfamily hydrolase